MNYILWIRSVYAHGDYPYTIRCLLELVGNIKNFQENKVEEKMVGVGVGKDKEEEAWEPCHFPSLNT